MAELDLTILMPCLNEDETLEICIQKAFKALDDGSIRGEVIIADNGSTDASQEIARRCGATLVSVPPVMEGPRVSWGAVDLGSTTVPPVTSVAVPASMMKMSFMVSWTSAWPEASR